MEKINKNSSIVGMTADDLKSQMFRSMKSSGVLHQLKSQLRQSMINELRGKSKVGVDLQTSDLLAATLANKNSRSWVQQAVDNLFLQHIKQSKYQYTLSLFQQESGLETYDSSLTEEILARLGISNSFNLEELSFNNDQLKSSTPRSAQHKGSVILLWKMLEGLAASKTQKENKENIFTINEDKKSLTLAEKLKAVDDEVIGKRKQFEPAISVTTLSVATKKAEKAAEKRAKVALEQWKALELAKMRVEESNVYKDKLESRLHCLENDFQIKRNSLQSRERSAIDRLNSQRETMEKEMHDQRQSLLFELQKIKTREEVLNRKEQLIHEMEHSKLSKVDVIGQNFLEETTNHEAESFVTSLADSFRNSHSKKQVITISDMNAIMEEVNGKSQHIENLKHEITELKRDLAMDRSLIKTNAHTENMQLREELEELKIAIKSLAESKNQTLKSTLKTSHSENLELKVSQLKAQQCEELAQKTHLEEMLKQMKLALEDSNNALLYLSNQRELTNIPQQVQTILNRSTTNQSYRDPIREYEPLNDESFQFNPVSTGLNYTQSSVEQPTGIRLDIRQRIKDLEIQSDKLDEDYNRYINTNYKQLLKQQAKSRTNHKPKSDDYQFSAFENRQSFSEVNSTLPQPSARTSRSLIQPENKAGILDLNELRISKKDVDCAFQSDTNKIKKSEHSFKPDNVKINTENLRNQEDEKSVSISSSENSVKNEASLRLGDFGKTSSEENSKSSVSSPRINTVRKIETESKIELKSEPQRPITSLGNTSTLPPVAIKRTLSSLPSVVSNNSEKPNNKPSVSKISSKSSHNDEDRASLEEILNSSISNMDSKKSDSLIDFEASVNSSISSKSKTPKYGDPFKKDKDISVHEEVNSDLEVHPPSISSDSDTEKLKPERKISSASKSSEKSLSKQNDTSEKILESVGKSDAEVSSLHLQPSLEKIDRYTFNAHPIDKTDESITNEISVEDFAGSISENIEESLVNSENKHSESDNSNQEGLDFSRPQAKKPPAYNLKSEEGISAMLKWGEENEPELHYSDDSFHSEESNTGMGKPKEIAGKRFSSYKDDHSYRENDEVDIFDISEHSFGSNAHGDNSKQDMVKVSSDESW